MTNAQRMVWTAVTGLAAMAATGCGYTTSSLYPADVDTVAVPVWQRGRDVYRRGVELRLSEAVVKHIESKTPYKVVTRATADSELTGTVERISQSVMSYNPDTGRPRELELTVYVSFTWKDLRSGDVLVQRSNFPVSSAYITHAPFSRDFFLGSEDVLNDLARRIVEQMQTGWDEGPPPGA
ncbi:MAG: LPS assembly lipoprotein LptE [Planctomycetota bacterium]